MAGAIPGAGMGGQIVGQAYNFQYGGALAGTGIPGAMAPGGTYGSEEIPYGGEYAAEPPASKPESSSSGRNYRGKNRGGNGYDKKDSAQQQQQGHPQQGMPPQQGIQGQQQMPYAYQQQQMGYQYPMYPQQPFYEGYPQQAAQYGQQQPKNMRPGQAMPQQYPQQYQQ